MRKVLGVFLLLTACSSGTPDRAENADSLTRAQKDSVIGASGLPGAKGVNRALDLADSTAARRARIDSISSQ